MLITSISTGPDTYTPVLSLVLHVAMKFKNVKRAAEYVCSILLTSHTMLISVAVKTC